MMLSASKIAFMPALALHKATPSPRRKPKVSLPSLLAAMRAISAPNRSREPAGTISEAIERCLLIVATLANTAFDGTQLLQGQRFLCWRCAWRKKLSERPLIAMFLKLEAIDDGRRHQYGG